MAIVVEELYWITCITHDSKVEANFETVKWHMIVQYAIILIIGPHKGEAQPPSNFFQNLKFNIFFVPFFLNKVLFSTDRLIINCVV
jgi:hypothetical protein